MRLKYIIHYKHIKKKRSEIQGIAAYEIVINGWD